MITYKCKNCGGQMNFGNAGGFECPYCGSKAFLSDADFKGNEQFRKKLLQYYKAKAEEKDSDYSSDNLFFPEGSDRYIMDDGQSLEIEYMKKYPRDKYVCYLAKESVVYIFDSQLEADRFSAGLKRLMFPPADNKLHRSFPELKMELTLSSGKRALVFRRRPNFYPAEMFAPMESKHLAWVISRMENICCALKYSDLEHGDINPDTVFINPITHEGVLFGDWRNVGILRSFDDLTSLRKTAIRLAKNTMEPKELYVFLNTKPESNAFDDFEKWDHVIIDGFGGHKFIKMDI